MNGERSLLDSLRPEVTIVGAGPTGLTAALVLAGYGAHVVVLDAEVEPPTTSRAVLAHASTLELVEELQVADELVRRGRMIHRLGLADQSGILLDAELAELPTPRPYALAIPQQVTEQVLRDRAHELGVPILPGHRIGSVQTGRTTPVVRGAEADGRSFTIGSRFLIGADGAHSVVRHQLGIAFQGSSYPMPLALADVELADVASPDDMSLVQMSPEGVSVLIRLPGGDYRVVLTFAPEAGPTGDLDAAWLAPELARRGLTARPQNEPTWTSRLSVHHRLAATFRVGNTFLAGDAAHLHSPASGQGMNTGIADGYDLGHRLGRVLSGEPVTALDDYAPSRRRAAIEVIRFTDGLTRMATASDPLIRAARRRVVGALGALPPVRRRLAAMMSGLQRSPLHTDTSRRARPRPEMTAAPGDDTVSGDRR